MGKRTKGGGKEKPAELTGHVPPVTTRIHAFLSAHCLLCLTRIPLSLAALSVPPSLFTGKQVCRGGAKEVKTGEGEQEFTKEGQTQCCGGLSSIETILFPTGVQRVL